jgi:hypothetical protein
MGHTHDSGPALIPKLLISHHSLPHTLAYSCIRSPLCPCCLWLFDYRLPKGVYNPALLKGAEFYSTFKHLLRITLCPPPTWRSVSLIETTCVTLSLSLPPCSRLNYRSIFLSRYCTSLGQELHILFYSQFPEFSYCFINYFAITSNGKVGQYLNGVFLLSQELPDKHRMLT